MTSRASVASVVLVALVAPLSAEPAKKSSLTREKGAIYVEDFTTEPLKLRVKAPAPVYSSLQGQRSLGVLVPDQLATLVAFSDKACRVRSRAAHGDVVGWVGINYLESKDPEFFDRLKKIADRQKQVQQLIDRKEIAIGMTTDEVLQALGKPDAESSRFDSNSEAQTFQYITYDRVPQKNFVRDRFGRLYETITYIKVETGRFTVNFADGAVSSIESTKGKPNFGNAKIVVPPINIY
jgi:outer membrane protein assembly factor BamE (lipoprotein component of BamABCDE complex)